MGRAVPSLGPSDLTAGMTWACQGPPQGAGQAPGFRGVSLQPRPGRRPAGRISDGWGGRQGALDPHVSYRPGEATGRSPAGLPAGPRPAPRLLRNHLPELRLPPDRGHGRPAASVSQREVPSGAGHRERVPNCKSPRLPSSPSAGSAPVHSGRPYEKNGGSRAGGPGLQPGSPPAGLGRAGPHSCVSELLALNAPRPGPVSPVDRAWASGPGVRGLFRSRARAAAAGSSPPGPRSGRCRRQPIPVLLSLPLANTSGAPSSGRMKR